MKDKGTDVRASGTSWPYLRWRVGAEEFLDEASTAAALRKAATLRTVDDPNHPGKRIPPQLLIEFGPGLEEMDHIDAIFLAAEVGFGQETDGTFPFHRDESDSRPSRSVGWPPSILCVRNEPGESNNADSRPTSRDR